MRIGLGIAPSHEPVIEGVSDRACTHPCRHTEEHVGVLMAPRAPQRARPELT